MDDFLDCNWAVYEGTNKLIKEVLKFGAIGRGILFNVFGVTTKLLEDLDGKRPAGRQPL